MSLAALTWAKRQTAGGVAAKAVLMALADYADERGTCWPSQDLIARETELTDRSVRDQLAKLEAAGLISRENRRRRDGTQASDRFLLALDRRNDVPAVRNDVPVPSADMGIATPEGRSGFAHDSRNDVPQPPEGRSTLTTFEPPRSEPLPLSAPNGAPSIGRTPQQRAEALLLVETLSGRLPAPAKPKPKRTTATLSPIAQQAWSAFPQRGRERSSTKLVAEVWPEATERAGGEGQLLAAIQAYARSDRDAKSDTGAPAMHRWLKDARFESWLGGTPTIIAPMFEGPPDLRAAIAEAQDEGFARSYVDSCHWQPEPPVLFARTGFAADELRKRCGPILGRFGVNVQQQVRT